MYFEGEVCFTSYLAAFHYLTAADNVFEQHKLKNCRNVAGTVILSVSGKTDSAETFENFIKTGPAIKHNIVFEEAAA